MSISRRRKPAARLGITRLEDRVVPANLTWQGDVSANWNDLVIDTAVNTNWLDTGTGTQVLPASGDVLTFPAGTPIQATNNDTTAGNNYVLRVLGGNYTLAGNAVNLPALIPGGAVSVTGGSADISLALTGAGSVLIDNGATLTYSGAVSNTYIDSTIVREGVLNLNRTAGATAIPGFLEIGDTISGDVGVVRHGASNQIADSGDVFLNVGTYDLAGFQEVVDNIAVFDTVTIGAGAPLATLDRTQILGGTISGAGTLIAAGNGIRAGTSAFTSTISVATLTLGNNAIEVTDNGPAVDLDISSAINQGVVRKTGTGTLQFSGGASNTYLGGTQVNDGVLLLNRTPGADAIPGTTFVGDSNGVPGSLVLLQDDQFGIDADVVVDEDGTLQLNGFFANIGGLTVLSGGEIAGGGALFLTEDAEFDGTAGDDSLDIITTDPAQAEVSLNGSTAFSLYNATAFTFNGGGGNDTLVIDHTVGVYAPAGGVTFNGGGQTGGTGDSLVLTGGDYGTVTYTFTTTDADGHAGSIDLDGAIVNFSGLEPIRNTGTATDVVFNLPTGVANEAVLEDAGGGLTRLRSPSNTFEDTTFTTPTGSLTVNGGNATDAITFTGLGGPNTPFTDLNGGGGDDVFTLAPTGGTLRGVAVAGGAGTDVVSLVGGAGDDAIEALLFGTTGTSANVTLPGSLFGFLDEVERLAVDGGGGTNTLAYRDVSERAFGSEADPAGGIVVRPTGAGSGSVRVGAAGTGLMPVDFTNTTGGLDVFGASDVSLSGGAGPDALTVLGVSTAGLQSAFGETTSANGADTITVTDTGVTVTNAALGALVPVRFPVISTGPTIAALFVRAGNEADGAGDTVTATPSSRVPILVDGMGPASAPGDTITAGDAILQPGTAPGETDPVSQFVAAGGATVRFVRFENRPPAAVVSGGLLVGNDNGSVVCFYDAAVDPNVHVHGNAAADFEFTAARVAGADFDRDGILDAVAGSGVGTAPRVALLQGGTGAVVLAFTPFEESFTGGLFVGAGDINGDGVPDIAVSAGTGGAARVQVRLSGASGFTTVADFFAFADDPNFRGGARLGIGDVNADGFADLVVTAGPTGGPRVAIFDGRSLAAGRVARLRNDFFAFDEDFRGGSFVAVGDLNGDGFADLAFGAEAGGGPRVTLFDGRATLVAAGPTAAASYFVFDESQRGGVRVAVRDVDGDGRADLAVGSGVNSGNRVKVFAGQSIFSTLPGAFEDFDAIPGLDGGVYVG